jgi:hypothetical protein
MEAGKKSVNNIMGNNVKRMPKRMGCAMRMEETGTSVSFDGEGVIYSHSTGLYIPHGWRNHVRESLASYSLSRELC